MPSSGETVLSQFSSGLVGKGCPFTKVRYSRTISGAGQTSLFNIDQSETKGRVLPLVEMSKPNDDHGKCELVSNTFLANFPRSKLHYWAA